ncbi:hypothetical protein [Chryseobacterium sp.]|uniref:hypothetical protein n=1 Tax=Chryseobacterium sp. TaxID=1871047 RepID=UPI0028985892|nr:hypothetical protein [Chryseobacterium sp.]
MKAKIRLAFRIVIDHQSSLPWDKFVFEASYFEYRIQHQMFDDKTNSVKNYWELLLQNTNAKKIPFLIDAAISGYVAQLNGEIKSLSDVLGNTFFPVESFKTDLVSSNLEDHTKHKLGITFYTPELLLLDIIDGKYLLSKNLNSENGFETFMMPFHPQVSIANYFPLKN